MHPFSFLISLCSQYISPPTRIQKDTPQKNKSLSHRQHNFTWSPPGLSLISFYFYHAGIFHLFLTQYMLSIFTAARVAIHVQLKNDKILTVLEHHLFKVYTTIWKRSVLSVIYVRNWARANSTNIKKCPCRKK